MSGIAVDSYKGDDRILRITISNPEKRNSLGNDDVRSLRQVIQDASRSSATRAIVIEGSDGSFCAGADIREFQDSTPDRIRPETILGDWAGLLTDLYASGAPVVAVVDGACAGGGVQMVLCSDICVASTASYFINSPGLRMGMPSSELGTLTLPAIVGLRRAKAMCLLSSRFDAETAKDLGICWDVWSSEDLNAGVRALLDRLLEADPYAVSATKYSLNQSVGSAQTLLGLTSLGAAARIVDHGVHWRDGSKGSDVAQ